MRSDDFLFSEIDWHSVVEVQKANVRQKVEGLSASDFASRSVDQWTALIAEEFSLIPPTIDIAKTDVRQRETAIESRRELGWDDEPYRRATRKGTAIDVRIPFSGDANMFRVRPAKFDTNPPRARVTRGYIEFTISGTLLSAVAVKAEIQSRTNDILEYLEFQKSSIGNFPAQIHKVAHEALQNRLNKLNADSDLISNLGYAVRHD